MLGYVIFFVVMFILGVLAGLYLPDPLGLMLNIILPMFGGVVFGLSIVGTKRWQ